MQPPKVKAPCQPALLGAKEDRRFFALPVSVIHSPAYRDLSVHARAVLVEIGSALRGWNNGKLAVPSRSIEEAVGCSPRKVVSSIVELMEHGFIDVSTEGTWKSGKAREYRITFYSTERRPATNDYLLWTPKEKKIAASDAVALKPTSASHAEAVPLKSASDAVTVKIRNGGKPSFAKVPSASDEVAHISKPYPTAQAVERKGDDGDAIPPLNPAGHRCTTGTCERCGTDIAEAGRGAFVKRFCSEPCRKAAERARAYRRKRHGDEAAPIGAVLNGHVSRLLSAGARA